MSALCLKLLVFHIIPLLTFCFNKFFYFALIFSKMTTHPLKSSHFKQEFPFFFVLFYLMFRKVRKKSRQNETLPGRIAPACLSSLRDSYFMLQSFYLDQYNIMRYFADPGTVSSYYRTQAHKESSHFQWVPPYEIPSL